MGASVSCITIAGVDNGADPRELQVLRKATPQVEWGVMWHPEQEGTPLHPDRAWINRLFKQCPEGQKSLHIYGWGVDQFVMGDSSLMDMANRFNRLVLNCNPHSLGFEVSELDRAIRAYGRPVITPHNRFNEEMAGAITAPNHHVLFDESATKERGPDNWPSPLPGKKCGYYGNVTADNADREIPRILKAAEGNRVWLQVVADTRDYHNQFDTHRTQQLLRNVAQLCK